MDNAELLERISDRLEKNRLEAKQDYQRLEMKVDRGFKDISERAATIASDLTEHKEDDSRVQTEIKNSLAAVVSFQKNFQGNTKWLVRTVLGAGVLSFFAFLGDLFHNHFKWF